MNVRLRLWETLDTIAHFIGFGHAPNWLCDRYEHALWSSIRLPPLPMDKDQ